MAKPCFHSDLAKLGEFSAVLTCDVQPSKIGKANYIPLTIDGEKSNYPMENQACEAVFRQLWQQGYRNVPVVLKADGWKDKATITFIRADQNVTKPNHAQPAQNIPPAQPQAPAGPPPQNIPPAQQAQLPATVDNSPNTPALAADPPRPQKPQRREPTPEECLKEIKRYANRVANVWLVGYAAAEYCKGQVKDQFGNEMSEGQFQACVASMHIQLMRDGMVRDMSPGIPKLKENGHHD